jgi:hypothetical protein
MGRESQVQHGGSGNEREEMTTYIIINQKEAERDTILDRQLAALRKQYVANGISFDEYVEKFKVYFLESFLRMSEKYNTLL